MDIIIATLSSINFSIVYLGLLPVRMKFRYYLLLFAYLFSLYYWVDIFLGQWLTVPLVLGCSLIVYCGNHKNSLYLTFALTGHLIGILINHIFTIPLSILGMSIPYLHEYYELAFTYILIFTNCTTLHFFRRYFILPKLPILSACPKKLLRFFLAELYVGLGLMTVNFIYGESASYPTEVLSLNGGYFSLLLIPYIVWLLNPAAEYAIV